MTDTPTVTQADRELADQIRRWLDAVRHDSGSAPNLEDVAAAYGERVTAELRERLEAVTLARDQSDRDCRMAIAAKEQVEAKLYSWNRAAADAGFAGSEYFNDPGNVFARVQQIKDSHFRVVKQRNELTTAKEQAERELTEARRIEQKWVVDFGVVQAQLNAARREVQALRSALEPFRLLAEKFSKKTENSALVEDADRIRVEYIWAEFTTTLRVGDLRAALALTPPAQKPGCPLCQKPYGQCSGHNGQEPTK